MFDVIWTDPDRELVGERRAKKEIAREQQRAKEKLEGSRSSLSSTRGSSSSGEKQLGFFFGSSSLRKGADSLKAKQPSTPSSNRAPTADDANRPPSPQWNLNTVPSMPALRPSSNHSSDDGFSRSDPVFDQESMSYPSSSRGVADSVISKWTDQTGVTTPSISATSVAESIKSSKSSIIQTLGPSSFITVSTEITVSPRTSETDISQLISEISISSDGAREDVSNPPISPRARSFASEDLDSPISLVPQPPMQPLSPSWMSAFKPNNPEAWRPPEAWDYNPPDPEPARPTRVRRFESREQLADDNAIALDLHEMGREIEMMAAADPIIILQRLREDWRNSKDISLYKEVEMEKKMWMLSALHNMDPTLDTSRPSTLRIPTDRVQKVLALHESEVAVATYLAAIHRSKHVYHMSPSPLSHTLFPNVHPLSVPTVSASHFPVAPQLFGAVYSLSLPSQISSHDIPTILKSIHRCLVPGGTLHLTLIDPLPVASSLGPRMRAWLEEHLLLNLERSFRCVNPTKLLPIWLADCALRGEGSTITTAKFLAVPPEHSQGRRCPGDPDPGDKDLKTELCGVVGRMLWREVWGVFIGAEKWWWEESACVDECLELGTYWEYNLTEAVKESS
ncbi:hypothetical protein jhhlp_001799 [Lomentospora prolificans]|uniref:Methyltransferase type 11 domain-containing protein n=1 Tax=Lomentospora prolificans TaxID=41688 RepID=A0A2N3NGU6_9PEZI|nr:hypothetical protein jhhlp_001799 [Lomentospora prolificans]